MKTVMKPLSWFIIREQVRKNRPPEWIRQMAESMIAHGQLQPTGALPDGTLIWGEGRFLGAKLTREIDPANEIKELATVIVERQMTETEFLIAQATENLQRLDLTAPEKTDLCLNLLRLNPEWRSVDLARALKIDPSMITRLLSPSTCLPAVQNAYQAGALKLTEVYAISKANDIDQHRLLSEALNGASRDALENSRKGTPRNVNGPLSKAPRRKATSKPFRIRCPLKNGAVVSVKVPEESLAAVIEAVTEALEAMKQAHAEGKDASSVQAVLRDRCKAGAQ